MRAISRTDAKELARTLRAIRAFASDSRWRPAIADIKIEVSAGKLRIVATDSYRLATVDLTATGKRSKNLFLPRSDVVRIAKELRTFDEVALISGDPEQVPYVEPDITNPKRCFLGLDTEPAVIRRWGNSSKAGYPDYHKIIPRRSARKWRFDFGRAGGLVEILKEAPDVPGPEAAARSRRAGPGISIRLVPDSEGLRIEWAGSWARGRPEMICYRRLHPDIAGTPSGVVVDRKYLLECLAFMDEKPFTVFCHTDRSPLEITNGARSVVLMPIIGWRQ